MPQGQRRPRRGPRGQHRTLEGQNHMIQALAPVVSEYLGAELLTAA